MSRSGPATAPTPRTCVGCRQVADRAALLRAVAVVGDDGRLLVTPDPRKRLPGRGAWLHPDIACLDLALRRKAFSRALRAEVHVDVELVRAWVQGAREQQEAGR
nr:YlxR family protein [Arsenicicoccus dermatophilus]